MPRKKNDDSALDEVIERPVRTRPATRRKPGAAGPGEGPKLAPGITRVSVGERPNMLITGVGRYWGERLALMMEKDAAFEAVHGIDVEKPRVNFRRTVFTHLDIRSPMILDFLHSRKIETVVHLQIADDRDPEELFQRNVMDTMFLLSACAAAGVRNVVYMSETAVYGFRPDNPALLRENRFLVKKESPFLDRAMGQVPHLSNLVEIEKFTFRFREKHRAMKVVPLRFAPIVGPRCSTWMTRYLREPVIPTALGFDPLVQVIHEDDVVRALYAAAQSQVDGPVNVAGKGVLTLHQLIRRLGKTSLPFAQPLANLWRKAWGFFMGDEPAPLGMESLRYSCIGDLGRMERELKFEPKMTSREAIDHFSEHRRMARYYHEQEPEAIYGKFTEDALKQILAEGSLGMGDR